MPGEATMPVMGFRLKISFKSERKFVMLTGRPLVRWCEACGAESRFVNEEADAAELKVLAASFAGTHRIIVDGRSYLCLQSLTVGPQP